jgi:alkylation response protein AidB-like acyl-CoA dehydrogenase
VLRQQLADVFIHSRVAGLTSERAMAKLQSGQLPGPEMSIGKLALTANLTATTEVVSMILGPKLIADTGEWGTYAWGQIVLGTPGLRVAGGTDEVMRNIVGERVLGLQKDPGIDSKSPFKDIKVGTQKGE